MAIAPIVIDVLMKGMPQVQQSFRGVRDAAARAQTQMQRDQERAEKARIKGTEAEAKAKVRAMQAADKEVAKAHQAAEREVARSAKAETREIERAAREKVRIHTAAEREVERIGERARASARRRIEAETRDKERASAQWVKTREREMARDAKSAQHVRNGLLSAGGRGVVAGAQRVGAMGLSMAAIGAQLGGGFTIADSVERQLGASKVAANISASATGEGRMTTQSLMNRARAVSIQTGVDQSDVLGGIGKFKDLTGDTSRGAELIPGVAKLATAYGGDISELMENAGNIVMSEGAQKMSKDDILKLLRVQVAQGGVGAVELPEMAKFGARLTGGAGLFGGDRATNIATMGAFAQIARQHGTASTAAEASMASLRFATDIAKHSEGLKAMGIDVSDGKGGLRDARGIVADMITKTHGDVTKIPGLKLGERGNKVVMGMADIYRSAGGGAAGEAAMQKELAKYTTGVSEKDVDQRFNERMDAPDKKFETAMNELRVAVGEQLLPVFVNQLVPAIRDSTPAFVNLVRTGAPAIADLIKSIADFAKSNKWLIDNIAAHPIGSLMAAEIAKAAIPQLFANAFAKLSGGGVVPGGGKPPGGGGPGMETAVGAGLLTYVGARPIVDSILSGQTSGQMEAGTYLSRLKHGSPADKQKALQELVEMQRTYGSGEGNMNLAKDIAMIPANSVYSLVTGEKNESAESVQKSIKAREILDTEDIKRELTRAIVGAAKAAYASPQPGPIGGNQGSILERTGAINR